VPQPMPRSTPQSMPSRRPRRRDGLDVAFVVPRSGPAGIYGPSCEACGTLAVEEINARGGLLGRELRLRIVDGGRAPAVIAAEVAALIDGEEVDAVAGWHISAVREALDPVVSGRVPYFYSPVYEGGERTPGVFVTGETPDRQLIPAMRWMASELGVRKWFVIGNDYVWPRASTRAARRFARRSSDVRILEEMFVPLGTERFDAAVGRVFRSGAQGVLIFLVGSDAVEFNRAFAHVGLDRFCVRLSPLMDENMLLATGADSSRELYAAAGFFETLATSAALDFSGRYSERFGVTAPVLNSLGESCYEGLNLLAELGVRANSLRPAELARSADALSYEGPRGQVRMEGNHLLHSVYLAKADGLQFDVIAGLAELGGQRA
jgi:urea transport system substrate-binding protein